MSNTKEENPKNTYKPKNSRNYWLRVKINGVTHRETLHTTSKRVAARKAKSRIAELRQQDEAGDLDWTFAAGYTEFYDMLDLDSSSWGGTQEKGTSAVFAKFCE